METKFITLENYSAYNKSFALSNYVWNIIIHWEYFEKETLGKQFTRAVDSISANIAEGFGRFSKKDKIRFYYYSLGSTHESIDWNKKCINRSIISHEEFIHIKTSLEILPKEINQLIRYTNQKLKY
ncbi:MAG: four helix bundle protein [Bacteroidales bacterium]|nr:four helix bundle protein [Bacteroidales bacterium]